MFFFVQPLRAHFSSKMASKNTQNSLWFMKNNHRDPPVQHQKIGLWGLKNGSGVHTLIEGQISPPLVFPHRLYFHPSFLGGGFTGFSNLDEVLSLKSLGSSSLSPFSLLSCGFFAACLQNEIFFKFSVVIPTTGGKFFHSVSIFSIIFSFFLRKF
jgi:hypothetical protein